jgi:hypothetical protein
MRREYRYAISAVCGLALLSLSLAPESLWASLPAACLFRNIFGIECFGCGMTRALSAGLHGHFCRAVELNGGAALAFSGLLAGCALALLARR